MNINFLLALTLLAAPAWAADNDKNTAVVPADDIYEEQPDRSADDDYYRNRYGCNKEQENCCLSLMGAGALLIAIYYGPTTSSFSPCPSPRTDFAARPTNGIDSEFNPTGSCVLAAEADRLDLLTECHRRNLDCSNLDAICGTVEDIAVQCYEAWKKSSGH